MRRVYRDESMAPSWGYAVATILLIALGVAAFLFLKSNAPKSDIGEIKKPTEEVKTEKEYSFKSKDGGEVKASVYDGKNKFAPNCKMVIFTPFIDKSDDSYVGASSIAAKEIFDRSNLKLSIGKAETQYSSNLNSQVNFWRISNFKEKFFCCPIKDSETNKIASLIVWIEKISAEERNTLYWQTHDPDIKRANGESYKGNLQKSADEMPSPESEPIELHYRSSSSKRTPGTSVHVRDYYRKDGTHVSAYTRSAPRRRR